MKHTITRTTARGMAIAGASLGLTLALTLGSTRAQIAPLGSQATHVAVGTAFTYQGRLASGGAPVNGACDFQFSLWDAATGGAQIGGTQTHPGVSVSAGYFTIADLDFGASAFTGEARWLAIEVRCPAGSGSYTALSPRQALTATPYAHSLRPGAQVIGNLPGGGVALSARNTAGSGFAYGLYAQSDSADNGYGVWAQSAGTSGVGVAGYAFATTGTTYGLHGQSDSPAGSGVYGLHDATSGTAPGVYGVTNSSDPGAVGVLGHIVTSAPGSYSAAVKGVNNGTGGTGIGVMGEHSGSGWGVYGTVTGSSGRGVYGYASATSGLNYGVAGQSDSTAGRGMYGLASATSGTTYGVYGQSNSTAGYGMYGLASAGSGFTYGVYGQSSSTWGVGVYGHASATSGSATGVLGVSASTSGAGRGVYGESASELGIGVYGLHAATTGTSPGVYGATNSTSNEATGVAGVVLPNNPGSISAGVRGEINGITTTNGYGVLGVHNGFGTGVAGVSNHTGTGVYGGTSNGFGVYGYSSSTSGYAGYFIGRVQVTGNLSKGGGSFKIDHPLDPANKYLYHSFVESPDMKNIYDGVVTLDAAGAATVTLPDWFEALNTDFRYQLTPIGAAMPGLFIAEEISANRFRIAGGVPGKKVSWQVTGIRQDAYARMNRIPVEEDKPAEEKGTYLHPAAFGQPPEKGLDYQRNAAFQQTHPESPATGGDQ